MWSQLTASDGKFMTYATIDVRVSHVPYSGAQVLRQNLARHWRAQRCQRPDEAAASPDQLQQ